MGTRLASLQRLLLDRHGVVERKPAAVGVPETAPVDVFSVRPAGSVPTIEKV